MALGELLKRVRKLGYPLRRIRPEKWREELLRLAENPRWKELLPLSFLIAGDQDGARAAGLEIPEIDCQKTLAALKGSTIGCPRVDAGLLHRYLSFFVRSGDLPAPVGSGTDRELEAEHR
jgi:hypothetical protein